MKSVVLEQESYLYQPEDAAKFVYFPETSVISELQILEDGRMAEVTMIGHENAVGLSKLFSAAPISNCVQVTQSGSAVTLNVSEARRLIRHEPETSFHFYPFIDKYIRQISQKTICNLYHPARERFGTWLLMVLDRAGNKVLRFTHERIAQTLGVYRPRITTIAREMKSEEIINYSRGGISICDRPALERSACSCYAAASRHIALPDPNTHLLPH